MNYVNYTYYLDDTTRATSDGSTGTRSNIYYFERKPQKPFPKWKPPKPDKIAANKSNRPTKLPKVMTALKQFQHTIGNISRR